MNAARWCPLRMICMLVVGTGMAGLHAQVRNDGLYSSIVDGDDSQLRSALNSGLDPDERLFVPDSDQMISLFELSLTAENDGATLELVRRGVATEPPGALEEASLFEILAQLGLPRTLAFLIERSPAEFRATGTEPLSAAIFYNRTEVAGILLEAMMVDMSSRDFQNVLNDALQLAVSTAADVALVQKLIDAGADPDAELALIAAAVRCSPTHAELLLASGADPNPRYSGPALEHDGRHVAAFAIACFGTDEDSEIRDAVALIRQLLDAGSDVCVYATDSAVTTADMRSVLRNAGICTEWLR